MISAIRANNFKKLESFSAQFVPGTNLIIGENAQGKSTVFEAIRFALFGSKGVTAKVEALTTWHKTGMWVELDILEYTIRRTTGNCKITNRDTGDTVASGNSPCIKFVEELLSCNLKDFDLVFMSKQSESAGLITYGATELNRKVEEYAGVSVIDQVVKSLGSDVNGLQIALSNFTYEPEDELLGTVTELTSSLASAKIAAQTADALAESAQSEMSSVKEELSEAVKHNDLQDRVAAKRNEHEKLVTQATAIMESAKNALAEAEEYFDVDTTAVNEDDIVELKTERAKLLQANNELKRLRPEAEVAKELEQAKAKALEAITWRNEYDEIEKEFGELSAAHNAAHAEYQTAVSEYTEAVQRASSGICGACKRPLGDHDPEQAESEKAFLAEKVSKAKAKMSSAKSDFDAVKSKLSDHNQNNPGKGWDDRAAKLETTLSEIKNSRKVLESQLLSMRSDEEISTELESLQAEQTKYNQALAAKDKAGKAYGDSVSRLEELEELGSQLRAPEPKRDLAEIDSRYSKASAALTTASNERAEARRKVSELTGSLSAAEVSLSRAKANNQKMAEMEDLLQTSKQLRKYLSEERVKFMNGIWRMILGTASRFVSRSTEGWITEIGRSESGDFTFTEGGQEAIAKESASGAQKAFIGTALKVGLAQAKMGSHSMVLLDEPTADMSNSRASQLAAGLMTLSGQKIMITHRTSERMIAQNVVQVGE